MATDSTPSAPIPPLAGADHPVSPGKWGLAGVKRWRNPTFATRILKLSLVVGFALNSWLLLGGVLKDLKAVRATLGQPALWRSAYFSQGDKFAAYTVFLNEQIPPGERVVLPPLGFGPKALGTTPFMQFFLAPRPVINCLDKTCAQKISIENTSVLVVEDFPGEAATVRFGAPLMFNNKWGLLISDGSGPAGVPGHPGFTHLVDILLAALGPLLWLGVLTLSGFWLVGFAAPYLPGTVKMALGYGLGLGALTLGLGLVWLAGVRIVVASVLWVSSLLLAVGLLARYAITRDLLTRNRTVLPQRTTLSATHLIWQAGFLLLAGVAAAISVGKGYSVSDEIVLWGAKGYGIAATGSLANIQEWGTNTVLYPLHLPILIAAFKILFAETLPAAKLAFSGYYLALMLLVYGVFTWKGVRRGIAGLATLLLATTPLVFRHATIAYANLPFCFYLVGGTAILVEASLSESQQSRRGFLLSGLLFAVAAWTRPEGLWLSLLGMLVLSGLWSMKGSRLPRLRPLVLLFSPLMAYIAFWIALKAAVYTQPAGKVDLMANAAAQILSGNLHLEAALYVMRTLLVGLFTPADWGLLGFGLVAAAILALRKGAHRDRSSAWMLAACGGLCVMAVAGLYFLTSYDSIHDISWWVSTGLERMLLPAIVLLWLGAILGTQALDHGEDRPIASGLEQR